MRQLRMWILIVLIWFFALLNIERFHEPINISSFVYVLAMLLSLGVIAIPPMREWTASVLVVGAVGIFLLLKMMLGYQIAGQMLPITITEALAITVSVFIAYKVAWSIRQFEQSVLQVTDVRLATEGLDFDELQSDIYKEVRRARHFQRPLSVVAIKAPIHENHASVDNLIEEVQKRSKQQYLLAQLANLIAGKIHDSDILTLRDDRFIVVLTETDRELAREIACQLSAMIEEYLGCPIKAGVASFPDEEITLAGLLSRAEAEMTGNGQPSPAQHLATSVGLSNELGLAEGDQ